MVDVSRVVASPGLSGRACKACSTSKAKCVPSPDSGPKCQRCQRLGKACEQPITAQRYRVEKKSGGRVAKLEEKLDSLVMLLNNTSTKGLASERMEQLSVIQTPPSRPASNLNTNDQMSTLHHNFQMNIPNHEITLPMNPTLLDEQNSRKENTLLTRFREMAESFPFVIIPPSVDARTLSVDRPFLFKVIMAAAEKTMSNGKNQDKEIMKDLADHIFELGINSLDKLLGLLVHAAWWHTRTHSVLWGLTSLLHQALSSLFDLGLNKAPSRNPRALAMDERCAARSGKPPVVKKRTLEERRVVLGCFVLISGVASYMQNMEPMRWTPYLEECIQELQKYNEYSTDSLLIICVRMQQMSHKINSSPWFQPTDQSAEPTSCPPILYIRAFQKDLWALKNELQIEFPNAPQLLAHYYSVEMTLYEVGLMKPTLSTIHHLDFNRLEILSACLECVQNFFDSFLAIPLASYWRFPLIQFTQMAYALSTLQRLSLFEDPVWDLRYVTEKLSFLSIVDQVCTRFEAVASTVSENTETVNVFARTAARLRKLASHFAAAQPQPDQMATLDVGDVMDIENMDGFWEQDWFDILAG